MAGTAMKHRCLSYSDHLVILGMRGDRPLSEALDEIPPERRAQVAAYLRGGKPALLTLRIMRDVFTGERIRGCGGGIWTDGEWVWTDVLAHYVERYGAGLHPAFLEKVDRLGEIDADSVDVSGVREELFRRIRAARKQRA